MSKLIRIASVMALLGANFLVISNVSAQPIAANIANTRSISVPQLIAQQGELNADKFNRIGVMLREKKKYAEAIEAFTLSIQNFPDRNTTAYLERAKTYIEMDKVVDAFKDFNAVIKTDSRNLEARLYRGTIMCTYAKKLDGDTKTKGIEMGREDLSLVLELLGPNGDAGLIQKIKTLSQSCGS